MKQHIQLLLMFAILVLNCNESKQHSSKFIPLFDGKTFNGWHTIGDHPNAWSIADGQLIMTQFEKGRGWLEYETPFKDFIFTCEWKVDSAANSGIFLRIPKGDGIDPTWDAVEIQISDDIHYPIFYHEGDKRELSGAIYGIVAPEKSMFNGIGEWNHYIITCKGSHIQLQYNGELVMDIQTEDYPETFECWGEERSSLASRPTEGYIGLQTHKGSRVWYRNIGIKKL